MKKDLYDILRDAAPEDLEPLWDALPAAEVDELTARRIRERAMKKAGIPVRGAGRRPWRRIAAAAACLVLAAVAAFATRAYAAELREYRAAVTFFRENELSLEGLTREEIKEVYRDISAESFTCGKTAEVMDRSMGTWSVRGFELDLGDPDPAELEALWNYRKMNVGDEAHPLYRVEQDGLRYVSQVVTAYNGAVYYSTVALFDHDDVSWEVKLHDISLWGVFPVSDGVIAWGDSPYLSYEDEILVRHNDERAVGLAKISSSGKLLWKLWLDGAAFPKEVALAASETENGNCVVLTRAFDAADEENRCYLVTVSAEGQIADRFEIRGPIPIRGKGHIAALGDEYLIFGEIAGEADSITRVSRDGSSVETHAYAEEGLTYHFSDMISDGEHVWLSGYSMAYDRDDILGLTQAVRARMAETGEAVSREELTKLTRDYYGAVLLVCSNEGGEANTVYSVQGSVGRGLAFGGDGSLIWTVERIESSEFYAPGQMRPIDYVFSATHVFRYIFGSDGSLTREDTGEYSGFGPSQIIHAGS